MALTNFKSYAGTKEIGPFHKNFSSVVGPNGSGKSNVIDSLLFVLGRRANQIRLKKLSELIHKSTDHPNLQECRVDIHFADIIDDDTPEGFTTVPNSEFIVSRIANAESHSTYKINNRTATGTEVQDKLKAKGMDLDNNRFLILQGEVELISLMKPKATSPHEIGILEYLEDLIGTNRFVKPIEELNERVEKLNEERQDKLHRLKLTEKEKDALEGPKLEAEEYQSKAHSLNLQKVLLAQISKLEASSQDKDTEMKKEQLKQEQVSLEEKISACTNEMRRLESEFTTKQSEHDEVQAALNKSKLDFGSFERKFAKNQEQVKHHKKLLDKQVSKRDVAAKKSKEIEEKMSESEVQLPKSLKKVEKLQAEKQKEEDGVTEKEKEIIRISEPYKIEIETLQKSLMPLQSETNTCQQAVDISTNELNIYKDKVISSEKKYNELKSTLVKSIDTLTRLEVDLKTTDVSLKDASKKQRELDEEMEAVLDSEVKGLKKRTVLLSQIEDSKASSNSSNSHNKVLTALLAAKKKKLLPGIFGRLGDLGTIDAKYDVAITTGVGALNMILVDNTSTGNSAIKFLKTNNVGRGTFLALDKQNFPAEKLQPLTNTPEGVPRLFDLIQVKEEKFKPAFYFACRDTLVASNMDQATRIAFGEKRWRVITLDGKVIDTAGTMSGGGAEVRRGGMASTSTSSSSASSAAAAGEKDDGELIDIKKAEADLVKLESNLQAIRLVKKELEVQIKSVGKLVNELESSLSKMRSQQAELQTSIAEYKQRCMMLEKSLSLSPEELTHVKSIETLQSQQLAALSQAKKNAKAISEKIDKLQSKIMEKGGAALEAQKKRVADISVELGILEEDINRMQVLGQTGLKKRSKLEEEVVELEKEIEVLKNTMSQLESENDTMVDKAQIVKERMNDAEKLLEAATKDLDKFQTSFETIKKELNQLKSLKVDLDEKEKDFIKTQKDANARTSFWEKKIVTLVKSINRDILMARKEIDIDAPPSAAAEEKSSVDDDEKKSDAASSKRGGRSTKRAAAASAAIVDDIEDDLLVSDEFEGCYQLLTPDEIDQLDRRAIERQVTILEESLASLKPNMAAILSYLRKEKEYNQRVAVLDTITLERDAARKSYDELRRRRLDEFMTGFSVITMKLKEMYQMLTLGGDAELELVDSLDPFSEGIVFSVRPPKKSWKNITNLSGGEKTLSSLALVFALHHYKPTPLYVMDEIDAALDFKNVSIVANYIKERTKNAQFIIISLRNNMFELADRLVGIYKTNNITKSITIDPKLFVTPNEVKEKKEEESSVATKQIQA